MNESPPFFCRQAACFVSGLRLKYGSQFAVAQQEQHRSVHIVVRRRFERLGERVLLLHAGACHHRRCQRPDLQRALLGRFVPPHDAVAGADARDVVLFGQKRKREFALFGFDGLSAQLNELPFGADERPAVFLLVGTAAAAPCGEGRNGGEGRDFQQNLHSILLYMCCANIGNKSYLCVKFEKYPL